MSTVEQQRPSSSRSHAQPSRNPHRRGRGRGRARNNQPNDRNGAEESHSRAANVVPQSSRARKFGAELTTSNGVQTNPASDHDDDKASSRKRPKSRSHLNSGPSASLTPRSDGINLPDLTAKLIETLKSPPYVDCVICWAPIHPSQPTWSCTPSEETNRCCWGVFHNKCIFAWSKKNIEETKAAYRARNEDKEGEWRCPSCQTQRNNPPGPYRCFCGSVVDPKPGRLVMPHSCGMSCQRPRTTCDHPCPLSCHPGPCPPCSALIVNACYCGKTSLSLRCNRMNATGETPLSCGAKCNKLLQCGSHRCQQVCHLGDCLPCTEVFQHKCYCGRNTRFLPCGEGELHDCTDGTNEWVGRFVCTETCERPYDCGNHSCKERCHPHSLSDFTCPRSPNTVVTCACGKNSLESLGIKRSSCTDPLPCCQSPCQKPLPGCDHLCAAPCHVGVCPPCQVQISRPCRCGDTIQRIPCHKRESDTEFLCNKVCRVLRNCGKHVCNRHCCPLAHVKASRGKSKQPRAETLSEDLSLHECDLPCGKLLNCGLHRCERKDHKGLCPPCLQSSFDEMSCFCGRTTLMPPIPCGTQISCNYPCNRSPPPCGHPRTNHSCHETEECPPCPFLTSKVCACGKRTLPNIRCSQEKVSCGTTCGKLLICGSHTCQRLCHSDECGPCQSICGKDRKLCLPDHHPCVKPCHAPSACSEDEPCEASVTLECLCGRIKSQATCGKSDSAPDGRLAMMQPKCTSECQIAQRNARLAAALGVNPDTSASSLNKVTYNPELVSFAKPNLAFVKMVEATLADFVNSRRGAHTLPHMPEAKRSFVHGLSKVYRIDTRMVDAEPQRSVELIKRVDSRIPVPLLSTVALQSPSSQLSLGKLQARPNSSSSTSPTRSNLALPPSGANRGWAAVASSARTSPAPSSFTPLLNQDPHRSASNTPRVQASQLGQLQNNEEIPADWEADE